MRTTLSILALATAAFASAGTGSETFNFNSGPTGGGLLPVFTTGFNPTLGTLTSVDVTILSASAHNTLTIDGSRSLSGDSWSATAHDTFSLFAGFDDLGSVTGTTTANGKIGTKDENVQMNTVASGTPDTFVLTNPGLLNYFTPNHGHVVGLGLLETSGVSVQGPRGLRADLFSGDFVLCGSVTYNYSTLTSPVATPEPASFAGLAALALPLLRKKRK